MKLKRIGATMLAAVTAICAVFSPLSVMADSADLDTPYIALGADLSADERAVVLELLGITEEELENYTVATVTNEMEHEYLDSYLSSSVIGSRALSSVMVIGQEEGYGVQVTTKNISYCTTGMYQNALVTAGMEDADVTVVGPFSISGTAALVGAMEAYENMTGEAIDQENVDAATNELVVTSELAESIGDEETAEELVGAVKDIIVAEEVTDTEEIEDTITETADALDVTLSEEDTQALVELMEKISQLDLDINSLKEQAQDLYDKLESLDIDLNVSEEQLDGFFAQFGAGVQSIWNGIKSFFSGLFGSDSSDDADTDTETEDTGTTDSSTGDTVTDTGTTDSTTDSPETSDTGTTDTGTTGTETTESGTADTGTMTDTGSADESSTEATESAE